MLPEPLGAALVRRPAPGLMPSRATTSGSRTSDDLAAAGSGEREQEQRARAARASCARLRGRVARLGMRSPRRRGSARSAACRRPRRALDARASPSSADEAVLQPAQAAAGLDVGAADAVVARPRRSPRRPRGCRSTTTFSGLRVLGDVGQRLGDHEVGGRLDRRRRRSSIDDVDLDRHRRALRRARRSAGTRPRSVRIAGWMPRASSRSSAQRGRELLRQRVDVCGRRLGVVERALEQAQLERERDELLLGAVVEVALDAPARVRRRPRRCAGATRAAPRRARAGRLQALVVDRQRDAGGGGVDELGRRVERGVVDDRGDAAAVALDRRPRAARARARAARRRGPASSTKTLAVGQPVGDRHACGRRGSRRASRAPGPRGCARAARAARARATPAASAARRARRWRAMRGGRRQRAAARGPMSTAERPRARGSRSPRPPTPCDAEARGARPSTRDGHEARRRSSASDQQRLDGERRRRTRQQLAVGERGRASAATASPAWRGRRRAAAGCARRGSGWPARRSTLGEARGSRRRGEQRAAGRSRRRSARRRG